MGDGNGENDPGACALQGLNRDGAANESRTFFHGSESHASFFSGLCLPFGHVKAASVVLDTYEDIWMTFDKPHLYSVSMGVLDGVVNSFLNHPVQVDSGVHVKGLIFNACCYEVDEQSCLTGDVHAVILKSLHQSYLVQGGRTEAVCDATHGGNGPAHDFCDGVTSLAHGGIYGLHIVKKRFHLEDDGRKILRYVVVQVSGNSLPFIFLNADELLGEGNDVFLCPFAFFRLLGELDVGL